MTSLAAALGFVVACGSEVAVGVRSDGATVWCNVGEYYYDCTPENPEISPPDGDVCEPWPVGTATVLWPPNHKLHTFTLADCAKVDACPNGSAIAAGTVTKITVDEEIDVGRGGDGHTKKYDAAILDDTHFELRSERQGGSDGRVYTVYYVDANGDAGSCQFLVPHNRGPHEGAVDSGTKVEIVP